MLLTPCRMPSSSRSRVYQANITNFCEMLVNISIDCNIIAKFESQAVRISAGVESFHN